MPRMMKALAKLGLIELSEDERAGLGSGEAPPDAEDIERLLAETRAMTAANEAASAAPQAEEAPPPAQAAPIAGLPEGQPLDALYAQAEVPQSPYPAEQLLRLLDGLAAMEPSVRKAAVIAMDNADDTWTIGDAVLDAERKVHVLQRAAAALDDVVAATESQAAEQTAAQDARAAEASDKIRAQIAELEALLAEELSAVAGERARIDSHARQTRAARDRERARLNQEMDRLTALYPLFRNPDPER